LTNTSKNKIRGKVGTVGNVVDKDKMLYFKKSVRGVGQNHSVDPKQNPIEDFHFFAYLWQKDFLPW